jgi:hypothetical protein
LEEGLCQKQEGPQGWEKGQGEPEDDPAFVGKTDEISFISKAV